MTIAQIEEEIERIQTNLAQHEPEMSAEEIRDCEIDIEYWKREIDSLQHDSPEETRSTTPGKIQSLHQIA